MGNAPFIYKNQRQWQCSQKEKFRMRHIFPLLFLVSLVYVAKGHGKSCRYWCRTAHHRYYCCATGKVEGLMEHAWNSFLFPWLWTSIVDWHISPISYSSWPEMMVTEEKHEKHCPPLRAHCPRTYDWYKPPTFCHNDEDCDESDKCCYDACLEHKTCKYAD